MKTYIAVEDINHPQAETVTDVEICMEFSIKIMKKYRILETSLNDVMMEVLSEMERGE